MNPHRPARRRARRAMAVVIAVAATAVGLSSASQITSATTPPPPALRLNRSAPEVTVERIVFPDGGGYLSGNLGFWVDAINSPFELRLRRWYGGPMRVDLVRRGPSGIVSTTTLPADLPAGFDGLADFFSLRIRKADGTVVDSSKAGFCPNAWERTRVSPDGPDQQVYPNTCSASVWTTGQVMGIEQGWSAPAFDSWSPPAAFFDLPDGRYTAEVWIRAPWREALGLPWTAARTSVRINLTTTDGGDCNPFCGGRAGSPRNTDPLRTTSSEVARRLPTRTARAAIDPATVPDLASLPAWGISTQATTDADGNPIDLLAFGATVWNAGPGALVVEGFRRPTEAVMDSHQFFYRQGRPVGSVPAGEMEYDPREGHNHWHFRDFAVYELAAADTHVIQRSGKEAWCLAPTDMVDLLRRGAVWRPGQTGLGTACGSMDSRWIREVLPVGWGDTYTQFVAGQAFDITDLPNGKYLIKVTANPQGRLVERTDANNVAWRTVVLGGKPGERTVKVPPHKGMDTEGGALGDPPIGGAGAVMAAAGTHSHHR